MLKSRGTSNTVWLQCWLDHVVRFTRVQFGIYAKVNFNSNRSQLCKMVLKMVLMMSIEAFRGWLSWACWVRHELLLVILVNELIVWFEIEFVHYPDATTRIFWELHVLRWSTLQPSCTVVIVLYWLVSFCCLNLCFISRFCKIFLPKWSLSNTQLKLWPILVEGWGLSAKQIKDISKYVNNLFIISLHVKYVYLLFVIDIYVTWFGISWLETPLNGSNMFYNAMLWYRVCILETCM